MGFSYARGAYAGFATALVSRSLSHVVDFSRHGGGDCRRRYLPRREGVDQNAAQLDQLAKALTKARRERQDGVSSIEKLLWDYRHKRHRAHGATRDA
jgi:hypothetical protein